MLTIAKLFTFGFWAAAGAAVSAFFYTSWPDSLLRASVILLVYTAVYCGTNWASDGALFRCAIWFENQMAQIDAGPDQRG